jgi:predicted anti-sigma-YlaC factor YlaD
MNVLSDIKMVLTLKCEESSRLLSAELDRPLRPAERIALRMHLFVCRACRHARGAFARIQDVLRLMDQQTSEGGGYLPHLSPEAGERIVRAVAAAQSEES